MRAGFRAVLVAPLLRCEKMIGMLVVRRHAPGAFPQSTIDLIKTFAAQSAVAIENARLFQNVEASLEDLRTAQDRLGPNTEAGFARPTYRRHRSRDQKPAQFRQQLLRGFYGTDRRTAGSLRQNDGR